jgi:o-succinylbenzoate---CoA ligase
LLSLQSVAGRNPRGTALIGATAELTFANLFDKSESLASALELGQRPDLPVAFVANNDESTVALLFALLERGITALPLHPRLTTGEQRSLVELVGARWLRPSDGGFRDVTSVVSAATTARDRSRSVATPRKPQLLVATSGSTGPAKLVQLSAEALEAAAQAATTHLAMTRLDRFLLSLNLAHIGGVSILLRCLLTEAAVVLGDPRLPAAELAELIEARGVTLASLVPTQLERLLSILPPPRPSALRAVLLGGAHTPLRLLERARALGWPVLTTYGLSEAGSQVTTQPLADLTAMAAADDAGVALSGIEVKIEQGTICIRGRALFDGYYDESEPAFDTDGWYRTNDNGMFAENGRLIPLGRRDDCIVTGGEKVAPLEVERAILREPSVHAAVVVPLPDDIWGQIVAAAIVLDSAATDWASCVERIEAELAKNLAAYKRPRRWLRLRELPELPSGKLDRPAVVARFGSC